MPPMQPSVFEGKYEIDSLCAFLKLSYWHYTLSEDIEPFLSQNWHSAVGRVLNTIETMQRVGEQPVGDREQPYSFQRQTTCSTDTLDMKGLGSPTKPLEKGGKYGLSRSLFRPSDDATRLPFNLPGNAMACVELSHLTTLLGAIEIETGTGTKIGTEMRGGGGLLAQKAEVLSVSICGAMHEQEEEAINSADAGAISGGRELRGLPYEVDGYGSKLFMDDANVPSLLSLPLLGFLKVDSELYLQTRKRILDKKHNPFMFEGSAASGIGGPHVGYHYVWPLALIVQAMSAQSDVEVVKLLKWLKASNANTGFMHESFNSNNVSDFTRPWFAWSNVQFGDLCLMIMKTRPHLLLDMTNPVTAETVERLVLSSVNTLSMQEAGSFV